MHTTPHIRRLLTLVSAIFLSLGLAACGGGDSAGPEEGAAVEDIVNQAVADLETQIGELESRVAELEAGITDAEGTVSEGGATPAAVAPDVFAGADQFVGEQVTVSGQVGELVGDNAFTIGAETGAELLVVSSTAVGQQQLVEQGAIVEVTGTVREGFNAEEVASELGVEFDTGLFSEFEGENYIVADNVTEAPEVESS